MGRTIAHNVTPMTINLFTRKDLVCKGLYSLSMNTWAIKSHQINFLIVLVGTLMHLKGNFYESLDSLGPNVDQRFEFPKED